MPFDEIRFAVNSFDEFFGGSEYSVGFMIMHELLTHPEAVKIKQFQDEQNREMPSVFHNGRITTSGISIATREDHEELLDGLRRNKVQSLHMVLHGVGETHDKAVNNKGAFEKLRIAAERAKAAGMDCTFSVLLTKANISELKEIKRFLNNLGIEKATGDSIAARYTSGERLRKYDEIRVEYSDIIFYLEDIKELYPEHLYKDIENYTEAALYHKAISGEEIREDFDVSLGGMIHVLFDKDFNVYSGTSVVRGKYYGNLKNDAGAIFEKLKNDIVSDQMGYEFIPSLFFQMR